MTLLYKSHIAVILAHCGPLKTAPCSTGLKTTELVGQIVTCGPVVCHPCCRLADVNVIVSYVQITNALLYALSLIMQSGANYFTSQKPKHCEINLFRQEVKKLFMI